jgi:hypothetical protein
MGGMRRVLAAAGGLVAALSLHALAEDIVTLDGEKHSGKLSRVDADGPVLITDSGIEKIPFYNLSKELQKQYGFDAVKAVAYRDAVTKAEDQRQQALRIEREKIAVHQREAALEQKAARGELSEPTPTPPMGHTLLDTNARNSAGITIGQAGGKSGSLDAPASGQRWSLQGNVSQKTDSGILVDTGGSGNGGGDRKPSGIVLMVGYPDEASLAEGDHVKGNFHLIGTYDYTDVMDAARTVRKYQYDGK